MKLITIESITIESITKISEDPQASEEMRLEAAYEYWLILQKGLDYEL